VGTEARLYDSPDDRSSSDAGSLRGEARRTVRELRWALSVVLLVWFGGVAAGYCGVAGGYFDERLALAPTAELAGPLAHLFPFTSHRLWGSGWLGYFGPNTVQCVLSFLWGVISFGLLSLWHCGFNAVYLGWIVRTNAPLVQQAAGGGVVATSFGILFPHGLLEYPAFLIGWVFGVRAGMAWVWPLAGARRAASIRRIGRDFFRALAVLVPMFLAASLLEQYANPAFHDRWILGIGPHPGVASERRVGPPFQAAASALSPTGSSMAVLDQSRTRIRVWDVREGSPGRLVASSGPRLISVRSGVTSFSWSPDGRQLALATAPAARLSESRDSELSILDVGSGGRRSITGGPAGGYDGVAWSPTGQFIAVVVTERSTPTAPRPRNAWLVETRNGTWRRLTHFTYGGIAPVGGLAWRPDGRMLAFVTRRHPLAPPCPHVSSEGHSIVTLAVNGGELHEVASIRSASALAWSPDGQHIVFVDTPEADFLSLDAGSTLADFHRAPIVGRIAMIRPDGMDRSAGLAPADALSSLSWSADGSHLAYERLGTCIVASLRGGEIP